MKVWSSYWRHLRYLQSCFFRFSHDGAIIFQSRPSSSHRTITLIRILIAASAKITIQLVHTISTPFVGACAARSSDLEDTSHLECKYNAIPCITATRSPFTHVKVGSRDKAWIFRHYTHFLEEIACWSARNRLSIQETGFLFLVSQEAGWCEELDCSVLKQFEVTYLLVTCATIEYHV